jgi:hypothetical protein
MYLHRVNVAVKSSHTRRKYRHSLTSRNLHRLAVRASKSDGDGREVRALDGAVPDHTQIDWLVEWESKRVREPTQQNADLLGAGSLRQGG